MIKKVLAFVLALLIHNEVFCQSFFTEDIEFIKHLGENEQLKDALFLANKIDIYSLNKNQTDSLNFLKGWLFHNSKMPDSAAHYLNKVNESSLQYTQGCFYKGLNLLYSNKTNLANDVYTNIIKDTSSNLKQLKLLNLAGIELIKRDFRKFDSISNYFDFNNYVYSSEQKHLQLIKTELNKTKKKSPFVAAMLSAAVPGLGKFYAGKKGSALATAATTFAFGIMAVESIYLSGFKSPQSIVFGSLFTVFYMGNIFGSAYSVKIQKRNYNNKINNEIIATLHIPIKRFFN